MVKQQSQFTAFLQRFIAVALVALCAMSSAWAQFTVEPERYTTPANSTLQLTLTNEGDADGSPSLEPLKKDFDLLGQSQSSSTRCVNFDCTQSTIVRLTVMPKHSGKITIPALSWGGKNSEPVTISVKKNSGQSGGTRVELIVDEASPYVQSQVILTVRAISEQQFARGQFTHLSVPDSVIVQPIDAEAQLSKTRIQGIPHWQVEQRFALFPQRSGPLELPAARFQAHFPTQQRDRFGRPQYALRQFSSDAISLDVQPQPAEAKQPWLPAKQLALSHYLSDKNLRVGEPFTLSISAVTDGLLAKQLPEISLAEIDGIKTYPDQPVLDNSLSGDGVTAKRVDKIVLIPTRSGSFTIPAISVNWWNTQSEQNERVEIGPIQLDVAPAATGTAGTLPVEPPTTAIETPENGEKVSSNDSNSVESPSPTDEASSDAQQATAGYWSYIALAFALLWLVTLILAFAFWRKSKAIQVSDSETIDEPSPGVSTANLRQRLRHGLSATEAAQWIADWGLQLPGEPRGLSAVAHTLAEPYPNMAQEIETLHRHLYSGTQQPWNCQTLAEAMQTFKDKDLAPNPSKKPRRGKTLPPLYPR